MKRVLLCGLVVLLSACANRQKEGQLESQIQRLEKTLQRHEQTLGDLREKNLVLESLLKAKRVTQPRQERLEPVDRLETSVFAPNAHEERKEGKALASQKASSVSPEAAPRVAAKAPPQAMADRNEHYLYAKVIQLFRAARGQELARAVEIFEKTYPESVHLDNAHYLLGRLHLQGGRPRQALKVWSDFERDFPSSNKLPSILLARALAELNLGRTSRGVNWLRRVQRDYPGSPESFQAVTEMKLVALGSGDNS